MPFVFSLLLAISVAWGTILPTPVAHAETFGCICKMADGDCQSTAGPITQEECSVVCSALAGDGTGFSDPNKPNLLESSFFSQEIIGQTVYDAKIFECTGTHNAFLKTQSSPTAKPPTPPTPTITPTLNVAIPGVALTAGVSGPCSFNPSANCVQSSYLADYIGGIFQFLLGSGLVIVVVMVMVGGFQYTLGAASPGQIGEGKKKIARAITGLILLVSVFIILRTVNPQLTAMETIELQNIAGEDMPEEDSGDVDMDAPQRLCSSVAECKKICPPNSPPAAVQNNKDLPILKSAPGFMNPGNARGTSAMQSALEKAGAYALSLDPNYSIRIIGRESGYRSIKSQLEKACRDIEKNGGKQMTGGILAWPGGSNHGSGVAVDIVLYKNGKAITTTSASAQKNAKYREAVQTLGNIMNAGGFVRYQKEIWHYELKTGAKSWCRCTYPNCAFPPHC